MESKPKKEKISITLEPSVIERLHLHADEEARSLSSMISIILNQWLDANHERTLYLEQQRKVR